MKKLDLTQYGSAKEHINCMKYGGVYPLSIAENIQRGDIYTDGSSFLFHHLCGFAHIFGCCDDKFINEVYNDFYSERSASIRRFILFTESESVKGFFEEKDRATIEKRFFFEYNRSKADVPALPDNIRLVETDCKLLDKIQGRITPRFSWDNNNDFRRYGKCICAVDGDKPAAWAFSAAVSSQEIDIGVETDEAYRHMGLGAAVAWEMAQYVISTGKRPVWACHSENTASMKLAEKIGFVKSAECYTVRNK